MLRRAGLGGDNSLAAREQVLDFMAFEYVARIYLERFTLLADSLHR